MNCSKNFDGEVSFVVQGVCVDKNIYKTKEDFLFFVKDDEVVILTAECGKEFWVFRECAQFESFSVILYHDTRMAFDLNFKLIGWTLENGEQFFEFEEYYEACGFVVIKYQGDLRVFDKETHTVISWILNDGEKVQVVSSITMSDYCSVHINCYGEYVAFDKTTYREVET